MEGTWAPLPSAPLLDSSTSQSSQKEERKATCYAYAELHQNQKQLSQNFQGLPLKNWNYEIKSFILMILGAFYNRQ